MAEGSEIEALSALCAQVYGERWQAAAARDLGVSAVQVARWIAGARPIPRYVPRRLASVWRERAESLRALADAMDQMGGGT